MQSTARSAIKRERDASNLGIGTSGPIEQIKDAQGTMHTRRVLTSSILASVALHMAFVGGFCREIFACLLQDTWQTSLLRHSQWHQHFER